MALAHAQPSSLQSLMPMLRQAGFSGELHGLGLLEPQAIAPWGGLFLPDPSIGRWAQWRQQAGPASFSLIGQIHTLSTPAAQAHLQDLVSEPVQPWDALICSSTAGREVVRAVIHDRWQQLASRVAPGQLVGEPISPQLPVIPLPLPIRQMRANLPSRAAGRAALDLPANAAVILWLGRLSWLTKLDPWPSYALLERLAGRLARPLVLIECGPDDVQPAAAGLEKLRALCPGVRFVRLGGEQPVEEAVKWQALAAADVALSLVDNIQETFGLAVAEAMAAGLPVVASNWDGYRDLVRDGLDGFLVPCRWAASAPALSTKLAWQQFTGLQSFPAVAGALAQLVQVDGRAAESALFSLLEDAPMAAAMGRAARQRAEQSFAQQVVMAQYEALFEELADRRLLEVAHCSPQPPPLALDPVRAFRGYASTTPPEIGWANENMLADLPVALRQERQPIWSLLQASASQHDQPALLHDLWRKHR
ncbi:glycosyltransferase family 4 protein [Cyanobium sp. WAJ14-Wanaka]|nr:glycosyltransferase family 4 protein [Cyanobium sp. WAJ14-Wanaka]